MEYAFSRRRTRLTQRRIYGASSFHYRLDANAFGFARARRVQSLEPFRGRWRDCTFDPCGPAESGFRSCGRIRKGPLWARKAQHELVARIEARWAGTCQARTTVKRPRPPRTVKRQTGSRAPSTSPMWDRSARCLRRPRATSCWSISRNDRARQLPNGRRRPGYLPKRFGQLTLTATQPTSQRLSAMVGVSSTAAPTTQHEPSLCLAWSRARQDCLTHGVQSRSAVIPVVA